MNTDREICGVEDTLGIFVGKWKPVILLLMMEMGTARFSEIQRTVPQITQKTLTKQLRDLEEEGIIDRVIYPEVPPRVEYSITDYGKTLQPLLNAMHEWGTAHILKKQKE